MEMKTTTTTTTTKTMPGLETCGTHTWCCGEAQPQRRPKGSRVPCAPGLGTWTFRHLACTYMVCTCILCVCTSIPCFSAMPCHAMPCLGVRTSTPLLLQSLENPSVSPSAHTSRTTKPTGTGAHSTNPLACLLAGARSLRFRGSSQTRRRRRRRRPPKQTHDTRLIPVPSTSPIIKPSSSPNPPYRTVPAIPTSPARLSLKPAPAPSP